MRLIVHDAARRATARAQRVLRGAGMARTIPGMVAFDTLKASRRLRDAGFAEKQADALVNAFAEDIGANLATKDDLALLRKDMASEFAAVRQAIEALESRMTSENEALRKEMALRDERTAERMEAMEERTGERMKAMEERTEERMKAMEERMNAREERQNARIDRQATRFTLIVAGLAGLILTAIGIATGVLATL